MKINSFKSSAGFSLIEMVIAIIILSIAVGTVLSAFSNVIKSTVTPELIDVSTDLAEKEMERVVGQRFSVIANEATTAYTGSYSNYSYKVDVAAVPVALASDAGMISYKQVTVTVTHATAGAVSLTTIVTNN